MTEVKRQKSEISKTDALRFFFLTLATLLCALCFPAEAQQAKNYRIGYLSSNDPASESARAEAIRLALRGLGYIDGQNIAIEYRVCRGKA